MLSFPEFDHVFGCYSPSEHWQQAEVKIFRNSSVHLNMLHTNGYNYKNFIKPVWTFMTEYINTTANANSWNIVNFLFFLYTMLSCIWIPRSDVIMSRKYVTTSRHDYITISPLISDEKKNNARQSSALSCKHLHCDFISNKSIFEHLFIARMLACFGKWATRLWQNSDIWPFKAQKFGARTQATFGGWTVRLTLNKIRHDVISWKFRQKN